jgi:hypothetical protein
VCVCHLMHFHTVAQIRLKLCVNILWITELHGLLDFYASTCMCELCECEHCTHARSIGWILSKIGGDIPWVTKTCMAYLISMCAHRCALCTPMRAFAHFWTYSLQNWRKHFSAGATCFLRVHVHSMCAQCTLCVHNACACTMRMHALHACAQSAFI